MTKQEFEELTPMELNEIITLSPERQKIIDGYFWDENNTDEEYFELCYPIYLEEAIEDGVIV